MTARAKVLDEGTLRFRFDHNWCVLKWDDHLAFRNGICALSGTKAVDFMGVHIEDPMFIEVKDFRGHRIANKSRLSTGDLAEEVAAKVRDSLAGLVWACDRSGLDEGDLKPLAEKMVCRGAKIQVVLWLEEDRPPTPTNASVLAELIRRKLKWLNPRVLVANLSLLEKDPLAGLSVENLPRVLTNAVG